MEDRKIVKTYKFRMYPSVQQESKLNYWIRLGKRLYNASIEHKRLTYEINCARHGRKKEVLNKEFWEKKENKVDSKLSDEQKVQWIKERNDRLWPQGMPDLVDKRERTDASYQETLVSKLKREEGFCQFKDFPSAAHSSVHGLLKHSQKAYSDFLKNIKNWKPGMKNPKLKYKGYKDPFSLVYMNSIGFSWEFNGNNYARIYGFPKMKEGLRVRLHRNIDGEVKGQTITKDGDRWYLCLTVNTVTDNSIVEKKPIVGVDLGIVRSVQLSDGTYKNYPEKQMKALMERKKVLQRRLKRKKGGNKSIKERQSNNYKKAYKKIAKIDKKITNIRHYYSNMFATEIVRNYSVIAIEDLKMKNLTKSSKGTTENPGTNVKQKSGLNRSLLNVAPFAFKTNLQNKAKELNSVVVLVDSHYTSQRCSSCSLKNIDNRKTQADFKCVKCGHTMNADHNAAINIMKLAMT